jgi:hypothetical protein
MKLKETYKVGDILQFVCRLDKTIFGTVLNYYQRNISCYDVTMFMNDTKQIENFIINTNDKAWKK